MALLCHPANLLTGDEVVGTKAVTKGADYVDPSGTTSAILLNIASYALPIASRLRMKNDPAAESAGKLLKGIIRSGGPTGGKKNVSAAIVDVPDYKGRTPLRGRSSNAPDKSLQKIPHAQKPEEADRTLTTHKVINAPNEHAGSRKNDAEIFIWEEILQGLKGLSDPRGTVYVASRNPLCPSCTNVAFEFASRYPGVRLVVFAPSKPTPSINLLAPTRGLLPASGAIVGTGWH